MFTCQPVPGSHWRRGLRTAFVAAVVGGIYALVSAYWALGGTWLLGTVGGEFERLAASHSTPVTLGVWGVVALKLTACALPLAVTSGRSRGRSAQALRALVAVEATILTLYGLVLSSVGWLVQARLLNPGRHADQKTLAWHAFLWDPWFLLWGSLVCVALRLSPTGRRSSST